MTEDEANLQRYQLNGPVFSARSASAVLQVGKSARVNVRRYAVFAVQFILVIRCSRSTLDCVSIPGLPEYRHRMPPQYLLTVAQDRPDCAVRLRREELQGWE
jgi:hypothetical protein